MKSMKAKISRTTWIILGVGVFVIALVALAVTYRGQLDEQTQLNGQIATAQKQVLSFPIAQFSDKQAQLTAQLSQSNSQIELAKSSLNQSTDGIAVSNTLFQVAADNEVFLSGVNAVGGGRETIEKVSCDTLQVQITAWGEVLKLQQFVLDIIKEFPTGVVKSAKISVNSDVPNKSTADISLVIYSYGGI